VTGRGAALAGVLLGLVACAGPPARRAPAALAARPADEARGHTADFARLEDQVIDWLAAADPRLARRADTTASETTLSRIGTDGVLAEDAAARIVGGSLDLFAFRARARVLDEAAARLAAFREPLPEAGPAGSSLARPRLERELLVRLVAEERARDDHEAKLGDAAGDLVRGIVSTWTLPRTPQDVPKRDAWVSGHLLEIRASLRDTAGPRTGPPDLDVALYPLERLLAPLQFPKGSAAIAELRMALDDDMRAIPKLQDATRIARAAKVHLGVDVDPAAMPARLERIEARLRDLASGALGASGAERPAVEARARELLMAQRRCPAVPDSRVRSMAPPPERAAICGVLRALTEEERPAAALVALHDDVLLSFAAVVAAPPPRTGLLSHPDDDVVDAVERMGRERPVVVLGVALAAEILYGPPGGADDRLRAWRALGEAPLDVVAREVTRTDPVFDFEDTPLQGARR